MLHCLFTGGILAMMFFKAVPLVYHHFFFYFHNVQNYASCTFIFIFRAEAGTKSVNLKSVLLKFCQTWQYVFGLSHYLSHVDLDTNAYGAFNMTDAHDNILVRRSARCGITWGGLVLKPNRVNYNISLYEIHASEPVAQCKSRGILASRPKKFFSLSLCKARMTATTILGSSTSNGAHKRPSHLDLGVVFVLVYFTWSRDGERRN